MGIQYDKTEVDRNREEMQRISRFPSWNGKTAKIGGGIGGVSILGGILTALFYLYQAQAQQPVIDTQQDGRMDQIENRAESNRVLLERDIKQLKDASKEISKKIDKVKDIVQDIKIEQARR